MIYEECALQRTVGAGSAPGDLRVSPCPISWLCPGVAEYLSGGGLWALLRGQEAWRLSMDVLGGLKMRGGPGVYSDGS